MTNNAGLKSCKNFYDEKFKEWQPTLLHKKKIKENKGV